MNRKLLALGGAAAVAAVVSQRVKPMPCPYSQRWMLEIPRPYLGREDLLDTLRPEAGEDVLELGPGTGYHSFAVAREVEPGGTLHVLDLQQKMLDELMRRAAREGIANVEPRQGDARSLPYDDATFDAAFLITVLGEIPDQDAALQELHRVIRPGGRLAVGEILLDPHFVRASTLERRAADAGFRLERRRGPTLAFMAVFTRG